MKKSDLEVSEKGVFVELAVEKKPKEDDMPDDIKKKVSSFPSMPKATVKLRDLHSGTNLCV